MDDSPIRRRLIKGSLAGPLVMTVSKAAVARTSLQMCQSTDVVAPDVVAERDAAMRVARDVYEIRQSGARGLQKLDGEFIIGFDDETVYRLERNGDSFTLSVANRLDARSPQLVKRSKDQVYVLAYFDDSGAVVGMAPDSNNGFAATTSCYASVFPNAGRV